MVLKVWSVEPAVAEFLRLYQGVHKVRTNKNTRTLARDGLAELSWICMMCDILTGWHRSIIWKPSCLLKPHIDKTKKYIK